MLPITEDIAERPCPFVIIPAYGGGPAEYHNCKTVDCFYLWPDKTYLRLGLFDILYLYKNKL